MQTEVIQSLIQPKKIQNQSQFHVALKQTIQKKKDEKKSSEQK